MDTSSVHPLDYVSVVRRRVWWLLVPVALALIAGLGLATFLPRQYQSTATLGISLPTMGGQVITDAQRLTAQERMRSINQVLLSPTVLEEVAKSQKLTDHMPLDAAVQTIAARAKARLPPPDFNSTPGNFEILYVDFTDGSPERAQRFANRLAEVFVTESSRKRAMRAEQTATFVGDQLKASQARLSEIEVRLRSAKESFMGALPEQTQSNVALVTGLQQQYQSAVNAVRGEQDRLQWIEREISGARPTLSEPAAGGAATAPLATPATLRVATLKKQLADARMTLTDKHPDVQNLKAELAVAEADAAEVAGRPEAERAETLRLDPAYRQLIAERDQLKLHIADMQRTQQSIQDQIGRYTARVDQAPRVEQQVATIQREYDLEKQQFALLTTKLRDAEMAESVERSQGSERFTLIARASLPGEPVSPNVPRILLITMVLGICLGGALALGREYLDRSIHDARALQDLDLPVLGEIPRISHV